MKFGAKVIVKRGSAGRSKGTPGSLREVHGTLLGASKFTRRVRLDEDDPLDTIGVNKAGDVGWWSASQVREE